MSRFEHGLAQAWQVEVITLHGTDWELDMQVFETHAEAQTAKTELLALPCILAARVLFTGTEQMPQEVK